MCRDVARSRSGCQKQLRQHDERNWPSVSAEDGAKEVNQVTAERYDLLLKLNHYKRFKEVLKTDTIGK